MVVLLDLLNLVLEIVFLSLIPVSAFLLVFYIFSAMPPRGNEGLDFTPILTHYLFLFTSVLAIVSSAQYPGEGPAES